MLTERAGSPALPPDFDRCDGGPELIQAVKNGHHRTVERVLYLAPESVRYKDDDRNTALHHAILKRSPKAIITQLLEAKADPAIRNAEGNTCMHLAFQLRPPAFNFAMMLLHATWDGDGQGLGAIEQRNRDGHTALALARDHRGEVYAGYRDAVAHVEVQLQNWRQHLYDEFRAAISHDAAATVQYRLLQLELRPDAPVVPGTDCLLFVAMEQRAYQVAARLVSMARERGNIDALFSQKDLTHGMTPLGFAIQIGDMALVEFLVKEGAAVNHPVREGGFTALHIAVKAQRIDMVRLLLEHGADPDARIAVVGTTPLMMATLARATDIAKLLAKGADWSATDLYGNDAASYAKALGKGGPRRRATKAAAVELEIPLLHKVEAAREKAAAPFFAAMRRKGGCFACCAIV